MEKAELKTLSKPDEVREFPKGRLELIRVGGATVGRAVFEPGWRWSTSVQPMAKTKSCEAPHFQYHVSGVLRIHMDDTAICVPDSMFLRTAFIRVFLSSGSSISAPSSFEALSPEYDVRYFQSSGTGARVEYSEISCCVAIGKMYVAGSYLSAGKAGACFSPF